MRLCPRRRNVAAQVAEELKTVIYATPPMEERRKKKKRIPTNLVKLSVTAVIINGAPFVIRGYQLQVN